MIDREKVIKGLECLITNSVDCDECPYNEDKHFSCLKYIAKDALELLKEHEYARCMNCQFRDFGENEVDSWDICKLHRHNTSPDEFCSWFVKKG